MTKQMKAEIIWDAFCEITERDVYSCCLIDRAYPKHNGFKPYSKLRTKYCELFKPNKNDSNKSPWAMGMFETSEQGHIWRMNALLLFREMILTGDA